ncbi:histidine kinase [Paenibacillus sepulcri]|uniref:Histidine kinase n=1 Tax=Paenibacillus sepulcri TaxID=359917 RepID=A0ABS7BVI3_9BACL|nr:histidine kinase [Paenibacillus sepulcri]
MTFTKTLRFRLLAGFIAVIVPLAVALFMLNLYAMNVVRDEVSQSTTNFLSIHVNQIDNSLEKVGNYLLRLVSSKNYYSDLIGLSIYPEGSSNYFFAKQRIYNSFQDEITSNSYVVVDTFFTYTEKYNELIASQVDYASSQKMNEMLTRFIHNGSLSNSHTWQIVEDAQRYYLVRTEQIQIEPNVYVGALIPVENLMKDLRSLDLGPTGQAMLISNNAVSLTDTTWDNTSLQDMVRKLSVKTEPYQIMNNPDNGKDYILVGFPVMQAPVMLAVTIPDTDLLQKLPYFQRGLVLIPIGLVLLLIMFWIVLKQVLHKPMNSLIRGMRRTAQGDFSIRLSEGATQEFKFLNETFNRMVSQIRSLKINVYEEMLKTQEAEFRHLQSQINPHFYLNSLNIIHSLSKLGHNDLVMEMAHHLTDFFRFITRANREYITLEEETEHIRNYLEIQRLRFPQKLTFEMTVPREYKNQSVLPLMIQPFVENAVVHGMKTGRHVFHITVEARSCSENPGVMEIVIADNGIGFSAETLERLNSGLTTETANSGSLGILNVQHRLKHKYGRSVSIRFQNRTPANNGGELTGGAEVTLRIPFDASKEGNQTDV